MRPGGWGYASFAALAFAGLAQADDGMPALLQFAEKYQQVQPPQSIETTTGGGKKASRQNTTVRRHTENTSLTHAHHDSSMLSLRRDLLARQQAELNALRQEVAQLRAEKQSSLPSQKIPDTTLLRQWSADLGRAWRGTPDETRMAALLKSLKKDLAGVRSDAEQARHQAKTAQLTLEKQQQADRQAQGTLRNIIRDREQKLTQQETRAQAAQKELQTLRIPQPWTVSADQLKDNPQTRLSYAAGSALGRDIQALLDERKNLGVPVERNALLAGVMDSITGRLQLPPAQLEALRAEADSTAREALAVLRRKQQREGEAYQITFSQQKGVKKSPMGFWYRVDYVGKGVLTDDTIVDVVVKEQLTDGTVIQDMALSGKVLSQPLSAFPPLFREAMGYLQNHGSVTIVVPPELAYGDTGYPPKIPPGATMVYELRIDNSQTP